MWYYVVVKSLLDLRCGVYNVISFCFLYCYANVSVCLVYCMSDSVCELILGVLVILLLNVM